MRTDIYIIRHAEAEGNIFRRMDGHYNSRITVNGQKQILALRERFSQIPIDAVYASDLFRTCETAKALYVPKGLELHKDARFREIFLGEDEDLTFGWLEHFRAERMYNFSKAPEKWFAEGAESYWEATDRYLNGLREPVKDQGQPVVAGNRTLFKPRADDTHAHAHAIVTDITAVSGNQPVHLRLRFPAK